MDAQDLKLLFEVIDVKAQSKTNEYPEDAKPPRADTMRRLVISKNHIEF